jgi:hypothetical protein
MNPWPGIKIIRAALRGIRQRVVVEDGSIVLGVLASSPWIVWDGSVAACSRCGKVQPNPPPVCLDRGAKDVVDARPGVHALHVLTTLLHPFYKEHSECTKPI